MSELDPEDSAQPATAATPLEESAALEPNGNGKSGESIPAPLPVFLEPSEMPSFAFLEHGTQAPIEPQLQVVEPEPKPSVVRHPNLADAFLFLACLILGLLVTSGALGAALYFHWHGFRSLDQASKSTSLALGTQLAIYVIAFAAAVPFFRMVWGQGYFEGLHWHGSTAYRRRYWLAFVAVLCNLLAMVGNALLPFPKHAPIDQMFSTSSDAWMLAIFGISFAPFFEEMIFRGFLLPAVATAWDWCGEKLTSRPPRDPDANGNPVWSAGAMIFASLIVSAPFAMMHAEQVGKAWGPIALLYCVSLILCAVRLATRSLASSTLVHSVYNFILFALMFFQTDGFRHMDKM